MNQSFKQVFVTNSGTLLSTGTTVDLAIGQVSFFDADTYAATITPTYFANKGLIVGWGYPDLPPASLMSGMNNENEKTHRIGGKKIKRVRAKRAVHGHAEIVIAGNTGDVADTNTLSVAAGQKKAFYLRLTGAPIDRLYSTQGFLRRYVVEGPCIDNCADGCLDGSDCRLAVENLAKQINLDPKVRGLVKASIITSCEPDISVSTINAYVFTVSLSDDGSDAALGFVQSQYPGTVVTRSGRIGVLSTYSITKAVNSAPTAVSNAGLTIIPDCPTCPSGYTLVPSGLVYEIKRADAGSSGNLTTVKSDYGITGTELGVRTSYQGGVSTYVLTSNVVLTAVGTDQFKSVGSVTNGCVITSATTTAWALFQTLIRFPKTYRISLQDDICGSNRLAALQAAFPTLTISVVDSDGTCVHTYETTIYSDPVINGCSIDMLNFVDPQAFEGVSWTPVAPAGIPDGTVCKCGIKLESAWVDRITNDCSYGHYAYEKDGVHIEFNEFDANYNGEPEHCITGKTAVKLVQSLQYPQGVGSYVRELEEKSKEFFLKYRSVDPLMREIEGFTFQADPTKFYDEVVIEYSYDYPVGMFSNVYADQHSLRIFVQEGYGAPIVAALNSYITSPEIGMDAISL